MNMIQAIQASLSLLNGCPLKGDVEAWLNEPCVDLELVRRITAFKDHTEERFIFGAVGEDADNDAASQAMDHFMCCTKGIHAAVPMNARARELTLQCGMYLASHKRHTVNAVLTAVQFMAVGCHDDYPCDTLAVKLHPQYFLAPLIGAGVGLTQEDTLVVGVLICESLPQQWEDAQKLVKGVNEVLGQAQQHGA